MRLRETGATLARDRLFHLEGVKLIKMPYWRWTCCEHTSRETMLFKHIGGHVVGDYVRYHQETKWRMRERKQREELAGGAAAQKAKRTRRVAPEKRKKTKKRTKEEAGGKALERGASRRAAAKGAVTRRAAAAV